MPVPAVKRVQSGSSVSPRWTASGWKMPLAQVSRAKKLSNETIPANPQTIVGVLSGGGTIPFQNTTNAVETLTGTFPLYGIRMPLYAKTPLLIVMFPPFANGASTFISAGEFSGFQIQSVGVQPNVLQQGSGQSLGIVIPSGTQISTINAVVSVTGFWNGGTVTVATHEVAVQLGGLVLSVQDMPEQVQGLQQTADLSMSQGARINQAPPVSS